MISECVNISQPSSIYIMWIMIYSIHVNLIPYLAQVLKFILFPIFLELCYCCPLILTLLQLWCPRRVDARSNKSGQILTCPPLWKSPYPALCFSVVFTVHPTSIHPSMTFYYRPISVVHCLSFPLK